MTPSGEDRTTTTTVVDGYTARKSTLTSPESWTVSYEETQQTGATYNPATASQYYGYWVKSWTCNIGRNKSSCTAPNGQSCGHSDTLTTGNWGWTTSNLNGQRTTVNGGCVYRDYVLTSTWPGTAAYWTYTYGWQQQSVNYSTDASATSAYNTCVSKTTTADPGRTRNCAKSYVPATWSSPSSVSVPSCPMSDTDTVKYTDCQPVTHTESVVTNYNVVQYDGSDPTQIIVTRDPYSTPDASLATFYGLTNPGATAKLFTDDASDTRTPKSEGLYQSQFASSATFTSSTVAVASGAYKRLQARGFGPPTEACRRCSPSRGTSLPTFAPPSPQPTSDSGAPEA